MRKRRFLRDPGSPWWTRFFTRQAVTDGSTRWRLTEDARGRAVMVLDPEEIIHLLAGWPARAAHVSRARRALMDAILEDPSRSETLARNRRDLYVACGVCPGCAYSLYDLPLARRTVTCPECGRAWVVPPSVPI